MKKRFIVSVFLLVIGAIVTGHPLVGAAQTLVLPQDIVFYEIDRTQDPVQYRLSWLDARTQAISTFYHDPEFAYWPIAWSPSGRYLAAIKIINSMFGQLCLFTRKGMMHVCINQNVDSDSYSGSENRMKFNVQWSANESSIFFITVDDQTLEGYKFFEANTDTGAITRMLYKGTTDNRYGDLSWSPQRDVIIEGVRNINLGWTEAVTNFVQIDPIHPQDSRKIPFSYVIPSKASEKAADEPPKHLLAPCPFSPKGTFVAAYDTFVENPILFALLDKQAHIVETIERASLIPLLRNCPVWVSDESAFLYQDLKGFIYKYFVADKRYEDFYKSDKIFFLGSNFAVSEDQNFILSISQQEVTLSDPIPANARSYGYRLLVIGPQNEFALLGNKYSDSVIPLWVPPLVQ